MFRVYFLLQSLLPPCSLTIILLWASNQYGEFILYILRPIIFKTEKSRDLCLKNFPLLKFVKQKLPNAHVNSIILDKSIFFIYFRFVIAQTLRKHQLDRATIRLPINITSIALPNLNQPPWLVWWYTEIIKVNSHVKTEQTSVFLPYWNLKS